MSTALLTALEYLAAYLAMFAAGPVVVAPIMYQIRHWSLPAEYLKKQKPKLGGDLSVFFIGACERVVALTLVLWAPPYLPPFIGGWVLLKFALGWQRDRTTKGALTDSMLAMVGNVLSFAIAVGVGVFFLNRAALNVWATAH